MYCSIGPRKKKDRRGREKIKNKYKKVRKGRKGER